MEKLSILLPLNCQTAEHIKIYMCRAGDPEIKGDRRHYFSEKLKCSTISKRKFSEKHKFLGYSPYISNICRVRANIMAFLY